MVGSAITCVNDVRSVAVVGDSQREERDAGPAFAERMLEAEARAFAAGRNAAARSDGRRVDRYADERAQFVVDPRPPGHSANVEEFGDRCPWNVIRLRHRAVRARFSRVCAVDCSDARRRLRPPQSFDGVIGCRLAVSGAFAEVRD